MTPLISICVNVDSRLGVDAATSAMTHMGNGARSWDFFLDSLETKRRFFHGLPTELIVMADEHIYIPSEIIDQMRDISDCVVIRKHSNYYRQADPSNIANDIRYLQCMDMATGDIICKMDGDTMCYSRDEAAVSRLIGMLADHRFICYPTEHSPRCITDPSFGQRTWASTRFFLARREHIQFDALEKCLREPEWAYDTFGDSPKKCNWLEHFLSLSNNDSVFYPPRMDDEILIWCWNSYRSGVIQGLNGMTFDQIRDYVLLNHGNVYPHEIQA